MSKKPKKDQKTQKKPKKPQKTQKNPKKNQKWPKKSKKPQNPKKGGQKRGGFDPPQISKIGPIKTKGWITVLKTPKKGLFFEIFDQKAWVGTRPWAEFLTTF